MAGTVRDELMRVVREHQADRDGGYALADAWMELYRHLSPSERPSFHDSLFELVETTSSQWGVALDCLVRTTATDVAKRLEDTYWNGEFPAEATDYALLALLQMGGSSQRLIQEVQRLASSHSPHLFPALASLAKSNRAEAVQLAAEYLVGGLSPSQTEKLPALITPIAIAALEGDPALVADLVEEVAARDRQSATQLAGYFTSYLAKPHVTRTWGPSASAVQAELQRVST